MAASYYKPSGKVTPAFFVFYLLFIAVAIPILSLIYIHLNWFVPFIYVNFFFTVGCGIALGFVVMLAAKMGKARNPWVVLLLTVIAVILLKYVQWTVYIPLVISDAYRLIQLTFMERLNVSRQILVDPMWVIEDIQFINEHGVWSIGEAGTPVRGTILYIVWAAEFLILMGGAILLSWGQPRFPFSEETNEWYTQMENQITIAVPENIDYAKTRIENSDFGELIWLAQNTRKPEAPAEAGTEADAGPETPLGETSQWVLTLYEPPQASAQSPYYITIAHTTTTLGKKDKEDVKTDELFTYLAVDYNSARALYQTT